MPSILANGHPCIAVTIRMPKVGIWVADLRVDSTTALEGNVRLDIGGGALVLDGVARRSGVWGDTAILRVVAGKGGMKGQTTPKFYRLASVRQIVKDILAQAGEALSERADPGVLGKLIDAHCQIQRSCAAALSDLCEGIGAAWRALPDGTIWVGIDTWTARIADPGVLMSSDPRAQCDVYSAEDPSIVPGTTIDGRHVSFVEHSVSNDRVESTIWYEVDGAVGDRQSRAIRAIVDHSTARLDFSSPMHVRVVAQNANLTLEIKPDDPRYPGISKVPIRAGLPGVWVRVAAGARAVLEFEDGDPGRPVVTAFEPDGMTTLSFGSSVPSDSAALALKVATELGRLKSAIGSWTPVPNDGGAALKVILTALFTSWPASVASAKIKMD